MQQEHSSFDDERAHVVTARRDSIRIAIVGMGATGSAVCVQFLRRLALRNQTKKIELHTFENRNSLGAGLAYGTSQDFHLLNMRAGTMSLHRDEPDDFANWLCERNPSASASGEHPRDAYIPRGVFGAYIRDRLESTVRTLTKNSLRVIHHQAEVTDCHDHGHVVTLEVDKRPLAFDYVMLCMGNLPSKSHVEFLPLQNYLHSPWDFSRYDEIDKDSAVGILGTGLTAVDVLLTLAHRKHRGPIYCFARRRSLPKVKGLGVPHRLKHVTPERLAELTQGFTRHLTYPQVQAMFRQELEDALGENFDWSTIVRPPREDVRHTLARDIADAESGRAGWHSVLDATSEIIGSIWRHMAHAAKVEFAREHEAFWAMYRHSMPLPNARKLLAVAQAGRLRVETGLERVSHDAQLGSFELVCRDDERRVHHRVDHLINAKGTGFTLEGMHAPLLQQMANRGQLSSNPLGGVDVDFDSLRVKYRDGRTSERVCFVGPLTKGVHFYTNSLETNVLNAERVVTYVTRSFETNVVNAELVTAYDNESLVDRAA